MTDPEETPAQAIERLRREISALRRLRAQMPMLILEPYVEEAASHIREVASRLTIKATTPVADAMAAARLEQMGLTQPSAGPEVPARVPAPGSRVYSREAQAKAIVLAGIPTGEKASPEAWEVMILTEDGRILTVPPEDLSPETAAPGVPAGVPTPKLSSGSRVKIKTTGKTGYVSEIADVNALVALDEGGFLTVPVADLEPI